MHSCNLGSALLLAPHALHECMGLPASDKRPAPHAFVPCASKSDGPHDSRTWVRHCYIILPRRDQCWMVPISQIGQYLNTARPIIFSLGSAPQM